MTCHLTTYYHRDSFTREPKCVPHSRKGIFVREFPFRECGRSTASSAPFRQHLLQHSACIHARISRTCNQNRRGFFGENRADRLGIRRKSNCRQARTLVEG